MIFIDANIFLAYDNKEDLHHENAVKVLEEVKEGKHSPFLTSDFVIAEVIGVSLRKHGKHRALFLGNQILDQFSIAYVDEHTLQYSWDFFSQTRTGLSLIDCGSIVIMRMLGVESIATFDKEFGKVRGVKIIK